MFSKCEEYQASAVVRIPRKAVGPICRFVRRSNLNKSDKETNRWSKGDIISTHIQYEIHGDPLRSRPIIK